MSFHLRNLGRPEPTPESERAAQQTAATQDELIALIRREGVASVARMFEHGGVYPALALGIDLTHWQMRATGGAVLFSRVTWDTDGPVVDAAHPALLVVNGPETALPQWRSLADEMAAQTGMNYTVVMVRF